MSSLLNKLKPSSHKEDEQHGEEQTFRTQPHPAKTNDPRDLEPPQLGGGLNSNPEVQAFHTPGPYIPSSDLMNNVEPPKSRQELEARSQELNK
ncbi:hypothetical protein PHLGIDRAFT_93951 [Phlebiopsis gigantea 11061_1 CR5-6]|uniref:Uncharacterized protein n=1 Tax=Phlebiopsis gigantea (strain 11061_1 CR5-6) TaxID=745531 RepID=A0A0C3PEY6_PHLG1|nr:hypothetical protein PHLGIDRAFT_93951 [Phlebiopsis gigantea 11061_1 CR5-6]